MDQKRPITEPTAGASGEHIADHKRDWKSKIKHEVKKFLRLFIYLYAIFGLLLLHESVVLARYNIPFERYGFALVTALVLAKVMLVMEDLNVARAFAGRPPIYSIIYKSIVYAVVFLAFYVLEETVGGLLRGKTLWASVPSIAGGTPQGIVIALVIVSVALVPYFAFKELGALLGEDKLHALLFQSHGASDGRYMPVH